MAPSRLNAARAFLARGAAVSLLAGSWVQRVAAADHNAGIPDGWFVWPAVEPVTGSAVDVSRLNAAPAGQAGRITVRNGQFITPDGQRVRFWGCNLSAEVAFPPVDEIEPLARRLAKGGVNIARLHHLDNAWAAPHGGSLWPKDRGDHSKIDPAQLDRLHRLIAALKAHGIYSNLNLKVSKTLTVADGFPESVAQLPIFQKRVDIFDPRMIELQKGYARQLLTTKNPYTGLSAADDPAVALIEINNENSLLGFWTRDLGRGLDKLPEPFRGELMRQWNTWLARHYPDDVAITTAWNPTGDSHAANIPGSALPAGATWEGKAIGNVEFRVTPGVDASAVELHVAKPSGVEWHAQAQLRGVALTDGEVYSISFSARADQERRFGVGVGLDSLARPNENWRGFGLLETTMIGTDWTPVRFVFSAHSSDGAPAALQLNAGQMAGTIAVKDFSLTRGVAGVGLQPGQSARAGTVLIPTIASKQQWADWLHFLADTERAYADEMRRFLKDDLGVTAPIVGSQIEYGGLIGLWREQAMDFTDSHAYWEHPELENGDFDSTNWTIRNSAQIAKFSPRSFGELGDRALLRVANKPFALSEYDHAAPSEFACEMYPTVATFACRQDWDALYPFDIGFSGSRNPDGRIGRYFDQLYHPAKWGFGPFAALVFRQELVAIAPAHRRLELPSPAWNPHLHADQAWHAALGESPIDVLNTRFAVDDRMRDTGEVKVETGGDHDARPSTTLTAAPQGQVLVINDEQAAGAVGFLGGATIEAGALRVNCDRFGRDFAAVTAIALDSLPLPESKRILVTIVARAQNQGIVWNADRTSVGANWGHGPPIVEHVPATISLQVGGGRRVYALAPDGSRAKRVSAKQKNGTLTFAVGASDHTLHYEVVRR